MKHSMCYTYDDWFQCIASIMKWNNSLEGLIVVPYLLQCDRGRVWLWPRFVSRESQYLASWWSKLSLSVKAMEMLWVDVPWNSATHPIAHQQLPPHQDRGPMSSPPINPHPPAPPQCYLPSSSPRGHVSLSNTYCPLHTWHLSPGGQGLWLCLWCHMREK